LQPLSGGSITLDGEAVTGTARGLAAKVGMVWQDPFASLDPRWTEHVIAAVGNYGDIFDRHLGPKTPLHMERGLNRLWTNGGLLYSPPFR